jgi:hypothetical protein
MTMSILVSDEGSYKAYHHQDTIPGMDFNKGLMGLVKIP